MRFPNENQGEWHEIRPRCKENKVFPRKYQGHVRFPAENLGEIATLAAEKLAAPNGAQQQESSARPGTTASKILETDNTRHETKAQQQKKHPGPSPSPATRRGRTEKNTLGRVVFFGSGPAERIAASNGASPSPAFRRGRSKKKTVGGDFFFALAPCWRPTGLLLPLPFRRGRSKKKNTMGGAFCFALAPCRRPTGLLLPRPFAGAGAKKKTHTLGGVFLLWPPPKGRGAQRGATKKKTLCTPGADSKKISRNRQGTKVPWWSVQHRLASTLGIQTEVPRGRIHLSVVPVIGVITTLDTDVLVAASIPEPAAERAIEPRAPASAGVCERHDLLPLLFWQPGTRGSRSTLATSFAADG